MTWSPRKPIEPIAGESGATTSFLLVHGTFGQKSGFLRPDSRLNVALQKSFPKARIDALMWSGRNSARHRTQAARSLRDELSRATSSVFLIGHSHGGNVIAEALGLRPSTTNVSGVACFGTPVLMSLEELAPRAAIVIGYFALLSSSAYYGIRYIDFWLVSKAQDALSFGHWLSAAIVLAAWLSILASLSIGYLKNWIWRHDRTRLTFPEWPATIARLFLRSPGDEASLLLGATSLLNWVSNRSTYFLASLALGWLRWVDGPLGWIRRDRDPAEDSWVEVVGLLFAPLLGFLMFAAMFLLPRDVAFDWIATILLLVLTTPLILSVGLAIVDLARRTVALIAFGDLAFVDLRAHVVAEPVPLGSSELLMASSHNDKGLAHSNCLESHDAIDRLVKWIEQIEQVNAVKRLE